MRRKCMPIDSSLIATIYRRDLNYASALDKLKNQHDHSNDEQYVYKRSEAGQRDNAYQPKNQ